MKKIIYHQPVSDEQLSAENTLELMLKDRDQLIKNWGLETYEERLNLLREYIENKPTNG